jgi:hypothetical protein
LTPLARRLSRSSAASFLVAVSNPEKVSPKLVGTGGLGLAGRGNVQGDRPA